MIKEHSDEFDIVTFSAPVEDEEEQEEGFSEKRMKVYDLYVKKWSEAAGIKLQELDSSEMPDSYVDGGSFYAKYYKIIK